MQRRNLVDADEKKRYSIEVIICKNVVWEACAMEENKNEKLILCKNCGGYYDSAEEQCPHCGEDTAVNTEKKKESVVSIADYGGGFGPRDSALARGALVIILILLLAVLAGVVSIGMNALSALGGNNPPAVSSEPEEAEDASVSAEAPVKGENDPDSLSLNYDNISLSAKQSTRLVVTAQPKDWIGELTWTTSDKYVATVDATGQVTYAGGGECVITVSSGTTSVECKVKCSGDAVEKKSTKTEASVKGVYPVAGDEDDTKADSSEQKDDTKSDDQKQEEEGEKEQPEETETNQTQPAEEPAGVEITLNYYDITLAQMGHATQLVASGGNGSYTWSVSDSSVATVDSTGLVVRVGSGTTTVTCTSGDKTKECIVRAP